MPGWLAGGWPHGDKCRQLCRANCIEVSPVGPNDLRLANGRRHKKPRPAELVLLPAGAENAILTVARYRQVDMYTA